jgi:exosortase A-associated hydrolase 1
MRFDVRGMGDSSGDLHDFEHIDADIAAAIDAFVASVPTLRRVVLWGLCDAASAVLMYTGACRDDRIAGLCLLNPWVRSAASLARTHVKHYYRDRLMQRSFWRKLLSGRIAARALKELATNIRTARAGARITAVASQAAFQQRMAVAWADFGRPVLLLLSENDYTANEFAEYTGADATWQSAFRQTAAQRVTLPGADHTCSTVAAQHAAEQATLDWLHRHWTVAPVLAAESSPA